MNLKSPPVLGMLFLITVGLALGISSAIYAPFPLSLWFIAMSLALIVPGSIALVQIVRHERRVDEGIRIHNASDNPIKLVGAWR